MNRNTAIAIGVLALIASAILVGPTVVEIIDDFFTADDEMSTLVEFRDEDGNLIDVPMAITAGGGIEVTTMTVTASWTVEGENIEPGTFNLNCLIEIGLVETVFPLVVTPLDSHEFDSSEYDSSGSHTWTLAVLLQNYMTDADKSKGWILVIEAVLTPTGIGLDGNLVAPDPTAIPAIMPQLEWSSDTGTLNIIECTVTKAYPP